MQLNLKYLKMVGEINKVDGNAPDQKSHAQRDCEVIEGHETVCVKSQRDMKVPEFVMSAETTDEK